MSRATAVSPVAGSSATTRPARSFTSRVPSGTAEMPIGSAIPRATTSSPSAGGSAAIGGTVGDGDGVGSAVMLGEGDAVGAAVDASGVAGTLAEGDGDGSAEQAASSTQTMATTVG